VDGDGGLHVIYRTLDGRLVDTGDGQVAAQAANDVHHVTTGPLGDLWLFYEQGSRLRLTRWVAGSGWVEQAIISGVQRIGHGDILVSEDGAVHVSFYDHRSRKLWYGRVDGTP
jgi:hypothetical protein